jgi:hypothetical protein
MKAIARSLAAVASVGLLTVVSACGSGGSGGSGGSSEYSGPAGSSDDARVVSVSVHQTGGLKPTDQLRVFSEDAKPPAGFTRHDVDAALSVATRLAASDIATPRLPQGTCADCYQYAITLTFADGSSTSYTVTGGIQQPKLLTDLLAATN